MAPARGERRRSGAPELHACTAVGAGCVAIYGGLDASGVHQNDLHLLHLPSTGPSAAAMPPASWAWVRVRQAGAMPSPRASPLLASRRMLTSSIITFGGSANPTEHGDATFYNDAYRLDLEPLLSALDSAQAAADAATASSAAQRDAPEVETEGIDPDATAALHTAKKPRVETHEEIETSEEDAAGSARKDGPPIAPEAVVATPMPAVPAVTFDVSQVPALDPRTGGRVRRRRRRHRLSSVAPSLCECAGSGAAYSLYVRTIQHRAAVCWRALARGAGFCGGRRSTENSTQGRVAGSERRLRREKCNGNAARLRVAEQEWSAYCVTC